MKNKFFALTIGMVALCATALCQQQQSFITRPSAFIMAGDTLQQLTSTEPYSHVYISRNDLNTFMREPVLYVRQLRVPKNNMSDDWEHTRLNGDITDYTFVMLVNDMPVSVNNTGNRLNTTTTENLSMNMQNTTGIIFTNINVKDRKTGKIIRVPDLVLYVQPDMHVVYQNMDMPQLIYAGYDNKIKVGVTGNMYDKDITYIGEEVTVKPTGKDNIITVTTSTVGPKSILVKSKGRTVDTLKLHAIAMPTPYVLFNNFNTNSTISVNEFINSNPHVYSDMMYPEIPKSFNIASFTVSFNSKGKIKQFTSEGGRMNRETIDYVVDNSKNIDKIEISDIIIDGPTGRSKLEPVIYYLKK